MGSKSRHLQGWAALLAVVIIADLTGEVTMSTGFRTLAHNKTFGPPLIVTWAVLTAHLFGLVPARYDPIHNSFQLLRQICIRTDMAPEVAFESLL